MKGTLRKPCTPGGSWSYRLDLAYDDNGKRRQRQVGNFATKREAQAALNDALAGLQHGTYVAPSKQTVRDFLGVWIDTIKPEVALTAWTNCGEVVERYVLPYLGAKRLADLSPMDIKRWHGELLDHGRRDGTPLAVNSVKLAHRVLHRALADGVRWNVLPTNPVSSVRVPKGEHHEMTVWTSEEARRFLDSLTDHRLRGLWALALHTGMRRGELAGLRWSDVDLEAATLTVAQQRTTAGKQTVTTTPKARSQRQLLLAASTVKVLRDHQQRQQQERERAGVAWVESGYVFVDESGTPLLPQRLTKMLRRRSVGSMSRRFDCTMCATRWRPLRSRPGCIRRSCRNSSVTPRSRSRWTSTRTSRKPSVVRALVASLGLDGRRRHDDSSPEAERRNDTSTHALVSARP